VSLTTDSLTSQQQGSESAPLNDQTSSRFECCLLSTKAQSIWLCLHTRSPTTLGTVVMWYCCLLLLTITYFDMAKFTKLTTWSALL